MARALRYPFPATELQPGRVYHVTNRGVDRCAIFHADLDRITFLAMLADACAVTGVVVHAFCLMTNHFHLVIEDPRGMLSVFMQRFETAYAQYFNTTRMPRRVGPLFQGRFHSDRIDDRSHFDAACAYVVNNPLRTVPAMAERPDEYRWSSAAFVLGVEQLTAVGFCAALLDRVGGIDAVLAAFAPAIRKSSEGARIRRFEALAFGAWIEREHVLDGRSTDEYRAVLGQRVASASPFSRTATVGATDTDTNDVEATGTGATTMRRWTLPSRPLPFTGVPLGAARDEVEAICSRFPPASRTAALAYLLARFCAASLADLARALRLKASAIAAMVERVRAERSAYKDIAASLWRAEWALHWRLLAAPFRL